jgi:hypothetical protein
LTCLGLANLERLPWLGSSSATWEHEVETISIQKSTSWVNICMAFVHLFGFGRDGQHQKGGMCSCTKLLGFVNQGVTQAIPLRFFSYANIV